jgi:hypothetical protein
VSDRSVGGSGRSAPGYLRDLSVDVGDLQLARAGNRTTDTHVGIGVCAYGGFLVDIDLDLKFLCSWILDGYAAGTG